MRDLARALTDGDRPRAVDRPFGPVQRHARRTDVRADVHPSLVEPARPPRRLSDARLLRSAVGLARLRAHEPLGVAAPDDSKRPALAGDVSNDGAVRVACT